MSNKKTKQIVDLYRTLLDPMGYTVVQKESSKKVKDWEPKDKEKYFDKEGNIIKSIELEKNIRDLKLQAENIRKVMEETRQNVITFMNTQPPNEITSSLYTGAYAKDSIEKAAVRISSDTLDRITRLMEYLAGLKKQKVMEEMVIEIQKKEKSVISMGVNKEMSGTRLQITIE